MMQFGEAVVRVLGEEARPLHWTVIQDLALRRGYLDPFVQPDIRQGILRALADLTKDGKVRREETGVYAIAPG